MTKFDLKAYANLTANKLKKNSPKILLGVGIVSGVAAIAYAVKVSLEVEPILDDHNERINDIKEKLENGSNVEGDEYTEKQYKADLVKEYLRTFGYFAKLYAPTFALETVSIVSTGVGFGVLDKRYVSAAAFAASTYAEYSDYRNRVAAKYGEEAEYEIYNNIVEETIETTGEDGKKKKEKVKVAKNTEPGAFSFFIGKDYCNGLDDGLTDEQIMAELKIRLASTISLSNRDIYQNGFVWFDKIAERMGVQVTDAYRRAAIAYDLDDYGEHDQLSTARNVRIKDAHILEGGEKVILVEFLDVIPEFKIDEFDISGFFTDKYDYKQNLACNN